MYIHLFVFCCLYESTSLPEKVAPISNRDLCAQICALQSLCVYDGIYIQCVHMYLCVCVNRHVCIYKYMFMSVYMYNYIHM